MMKLKRFMSVGLAAVTAAGLLAGCGSSGSSSQSGSAAGTTAAAADTAASDASGDEACTLRVALWDYSNLDYYKTIFDAFQELHPDIQLDIVEFSADEYPTIITTQLSGKQDFDVVFNKDLQTLSQLISQGHIMALDDFIDGDSEFNKDNYSGLIDQLEMDGKCYGVPFRKDNWLLFYNKDLFDAAGVAYPEDGMTLDEFEALAEKMTSGEGNDKVYGMHMHTWYNNATQYARRVEEFNPIDSSTYDAILPYYQTMLDMQSKGYIQDYGSLKASNIHYSGVFYNQQAAMISMGTWFINMLAENVDFNWGVCSMPNDKGEGNTQAVGAVTPVSIGAYAKHPEQAWTLIKYICGEEGAKVLAGTGILPGYGSDAINQIFDDLHNQYPGAPEELSKYIDLDKYVIEFPMNEKAKDIDTIIGEEHSAIMTGTETAEEGIANMKSRVDALQ